MRVRSFHLDYKPSLYLGERSFLHGVMRVSFWRDIFASRNTMGTHFYGHKVETASQIPSNSGQRHKQPNCFRNGFLEAICIDCIWVQKGSFESDQAVSGESNCCRYLFRTGVPF